jgi:outer membrane biosynthesis protein TonB
MSYDDNNRPNDSRDRGPYTPPTDDDLPFNRGGGFDARRGPPAKAPPVTLIVSAVVLLVLIVAVVLFYRSGLRASNDVPPAVGTPVGQMKVEAPQDAQPVDEEAGVDVYRDETPPVDTAPTYAPPPETARPRPAPKPLPPVASDDLAPAHPATRPTPTPPVVRPSPQATQTPPTPAAASGASAVQIGAFSSTAIADREFAAVAARFPQFARGAQKRVQEVTASNGSTVYRTTFYGLSRERAQAFCSAIQSAGGDCLVR